MSSKADLMNTSKIRYLVLVVNRDLRDTRVNARFRINICHGKTQLGLDLFT